MSNDLSKEFERQTAKSCRLEAEVAKLTKEIEVQTTARRDMDRVACIWAQRAEEAEALVETANGALLGLVVLADLYFEQHGRDPYVNDNYCRAKDWFQHLETWRRNARAAQGGEKS